MKREKFRKKKKERKKERKKEKIKKEHYLNLTRGEWLTYLG